jgi:hypothetical protein
LGVKIDEEMLKKFTRKLKNRVRDFLLTRKKDLDKTMEVPDSWNQWYQHQVTKKEKVSDSNIIEKMNWLLVSFIRDLYTLNRHIF